MYTRSQLLDFLNHIGIFSSLGIHEQHVVLDHCSVAQYRANEVVIEQGNMGDKLYGILSGKVRILKRKPSEGWILVNTLNRGDVFGEIAILRNIPRTSRVVTEIPSTFLTITAGDFLKLYQNFPPKVRDDIQLLMAKRLAQLGSMRIP